MSLMYALNPSSRDALTIPSVEVPLARVAPDNFASFFQFF